MAVGGVYAITPATLDTPNLLARCEAAIRGGVAALQYREKTGDVALRYEQASELLALCRQYRVPFIVNDDLRLADMVGADGVHLGQEDGSIREARIILGPGKMIGVSCYQSLDRAHYAQRLAADYVAFGSFFPSPSKPEAKRADLSLLRSASREISLPIVAIGGITVDNANELIEAGADAIAVISALFDSTDVESAARSLNALFEIESEN
ncbi:MAG: thiamine phosphate synthase [Thiobacillaceae bacterium]